jgi:small subunit ribosomal protein S8
MSYINLLTKIKNAQEAEKGFLKVPFSKMDLAVADLLVKAGYLKSVEIKGKADRRLIEINLKDEKAIKGVKFISRPSRKIYAGYKNLKPVKSGYGLTALSTPKGIMSNKEARQQKLGGQLLFEIW